MFAIIFTIVSFVIQQVSAANMRRKQSEARDAAERKAEAAKGTSVVVYGEAVALKVLYGRNLIGGVRLYHNTFNDYVYAPPASGTRHGSFSASSLAVSAPTVGSAVSGKTESVVTVTSAATYAGYSGEFATDIAITVTKEIPVGTLISGTVGSSTIVGYNAIVTLNAGSEVQSVNGTAADPAPRVFDDNFPPGGGLANPFGFSHTVGDIVHTVKLVGPTTLVGSTTIKLTDADKMRSGENPESSNHEFLITQQALGFGGINACYSIDVDERKLIGETNNEFNEIVYPRDPSPDAFKGLTPDADGWYPKSAITSFFDADQLAKITPKGIQHVNPYRDTCLMHVYYDGNVADPLVVANDSNRSTATFTNTAYATSVYKWMRDDPAYNGVPNAQFYVEGMRVSTIGGSRGARTINSTKVYSNNPALCLLDYLTNPLYGRGLQATDLDLDSFYDAYVICEKTVMPNVPLDGALWRLKGGPRDVKLYECNIALDSSASLRKNIEVILETMNDADLIWSGGKYKLRLMYPEIYTGGETYDEGEVVQYSADGLTDDLYRSLTNGNGSVPTIGANWEYATVAHITDNDIVRQGATTINWPSASTRLNYATVRFTNESKDFVEDTAYWPPKQVEGGAPFVYNTYLAEDSGLELSTDVFATGCASSYAAIAKAEYIVRNSRQAVTYELTIARDFIWIETGDIIYVNSDALNIPGELMKVLSVTPDATANSIKLSLVKYDAFALAWNVADDEPGTKRNIYTSDLAQASNLRWHVRTNAENAASGFNSYGELKWDAAKDSRVTGYYVGYTTVPKAKVTRGTHYEILGETSATHMFSGPDLAEGQYTVGVVSRDAAGKIAPQFGRHSRWPLLEITINHLPQVTNLQVDLYNTPEEFEAAALLPEKSAGVLTWDLPDVPGASRIVDYIVGYTPLTAARFIEGPPWPVGMDDPNARYPIRAVVTSRRFVLPEIPPGTYTIGVAPRDAKGKTSNEWASVEDHFTVISFTVGRPWQVRNLAYRVFSPAESARYPGNPYGILTWDAALGGTPVKDYVVGYTPMTAAQFEGGPDTDATEDANHWPPSLDTFEKRYPWFQATDTTSFLLPSTVADGSYTVGVTGRTADGTLSPEYDIALEVGEQHWPVVTITKGQLPQVTGLAYHQYTKAESDALVVPAWGIVTWDKSTDSRVAYYTIGYTKGTVANNKAAYEAIVIEAHADTTINSFTIPFLPNGTYTAGVICRDASGNSSPMWFEAAPFSPAAPSKVALIPVTITGSVASGLSFTVFNLAQFAANGGKYGKLTWTASTSADFEEYVIGYKVAGGDWLDFVYTKETYWLAPVPPMGTYTIGVGIRNKNGSVSDKGTWPTINVTVALPANVTGMSFNQYDAATKAANGNAAGKLTWNASTDPSVVDYVVGYKVAGGDWIDWVTTPNNYWLAPDAPNGTYTVGVATRNRDGVLSAQTWPTVTATITNAIQSESTRSYHSEAALPSGTTGGIGIDVPAGYVANAILTANSSITGSTTVFDVTLSVGATRNGSPYATNAFLVRGTADGSPYAPFAGSLATGATLIDIPAGYYVVWADAVIVSGTASGYVQGVHLYLSVTLRKL